VYWDRLSSPFATALEATRSTLCDSGVLVVALFDLSVGVCLRSPGPLAFPFALPLDLLPVESLRVRGSGPLRRDL